MTQEELKQKIVGFGEITEKQRNKIICSLIGHSHICTSFMGYRYCGRCNEELGDNLGGYDTGVKDAVLVGHNCKTCRRNYIDCTWKDKLYVKDPFIESQFEKEYKEAPYLLEL